MHNGDSPETQAKQSIGTLPAVFITSLHNTDSFYHKWATAILQKV